LFQKANVTKFIAVLTSLQALAAHLAFQRLITKKIWRVEINIFAVSEVELFGT